MKKFLKIGLTLMFCGVLFITPKKASASVYYSGVIGTSTKTTITAKGTMAGKSFTLGKLTVYTSPYTANAKYECNYISQVTVYASTSGNGEWNKKEKNLAPGYSISVSKSVSGYNPPAYGQVMVTYN